MTNCDFMFKYSKEGDTNPGNSLRLLEIQYLFGCHQLIEAILLRH